MKQLSCFKLMKAGTWKSELRPHVPPCFENKKIEEVTDEFWSITLDLTNLKSNNLNRFADLITPSATACATGSLTGGIATFDNVLPLLNLNLGADPLYLSHPLRSYTLHVFSFRICTLEL